MLPGVLALLTGTDVLGNAAHHLWAGGLLTFVAGVGFALVGDFGGRRFTTWAGGAFAALGVYTFAGDVTNFDDSFDFDPMLVRPALVTIAFGIGLVALAWFVASFRSRYPGSGGSEPPAAPPPVQPDPWQPPQPPSGPWAPPA